MPDKAIEKFLGENPSLEDLCRLVTPKSAPKTALLTKKKRFTTYKIAREKLIEAFAEKGWKVRDGLKTPHATNKNGFVRYWFKPQAVYVSIDKEGKHHLVRAKSTGQDMREPRTFQKLIQYATEKSKNIIPLQPPYQSPPSVAKWSKNIEQIIKNIGPKGRFGGRKVFIDSAYRAYKRQGGTKNRREFKEQLVEANKQGKLRLIRADLVSAMDPEKVKASETAYLNATFHFIEDPRASS